MKEIDLDEILDEIEDYAALPINDDAVLADNNFLQVEFDEQSGSVELDGNKVYIRNIRNVIYGEG